jgi:LacI family transcriptional regulator
VARFAGVSTASVSRAINFPDKVSPELRGRVEKAAQLLHWVPNGAAKALASLRSRTIGALVPTLGHQNFATMLEALQRNLHRDNYTLILGCMESTPDARVLQARKMIERGIDFLVLVGEAQPAPLFALLETQNIPFVITYTSGRLSPHPCIGFDNYAASERVTDHLLSLGHRNFGLIAASSTDNDRIQQRIAAVKDALARHGLGIRSEHFAEVESSRHIAAGRAGLERIWASTEPPTAVICTNDYLATGAMIEARARQIEIPRDLSVSGFDDVDLSEHLEPPLTTIRVPAGDLGTAIAEHVIRYLDHGDANRPLPLTAELMVRGSTAAPRRAS